MRKNPLLRKYTYLALLGRVLPALKPKSKVELMNCLFAAIITMRHRHDSTDMPTLIDRRRQLFGREVIPAIFLASNGTLYRRRFGTFTPLKPRDIVAFSVRKGQRLLESLRA